MTKKYFFIAFFSFLIAISFWSCKKILYNKLQGKWRYINVVDLSHNEEYQEWEFKEDSLIVTDYYTKDGELRAKTSEKTTFEIIYVKRHRLISLSDTLDALRPNYQFRVVRLDARAMVFVDGTEGGIRIYELERLK